MTEREQQVLAAMRSTHWAGRPAWLARVLNRDGPCDWCPVGTPRQGEKCASVPPSSRRAVAAVLAALVRAGLVVKMYPGTRMMVYVEKGSVR